MVPFGTLQRSLGVPGKFDISTSAIRKVLHFGECPLNDQQRVHAHASILAAGVQRLPVNHQPNVRWLRAAVSNEYPALDRFIDRAPENDVTLITGKEVFTGFVVRCLVQLNAENVPVKRPFLLLAFTFNRINRQFREH